MSLPDQPRARPGTGFFSATYHHRLLRCRLCWRIGLLVLFSILAIEAIILLPSLRNHERDLLSRIEETTVAGLTAVAATARSDAPANLGSTLSALLDGTPLRGGAFLDRAGRSAGVFGEAPTLNRAALRDRAPRQRRVDDGERFEFLWPAEKSGFQHDIAVRADASAVNGKLWSFVYRIGGLTLLISAFVTAISVLILGHLVLAPVLALREHLIAASQDPEHPERFTAERQRNDELGEIVRRINILMKFISSARRAALARVMAMTDNSLDGIVAYGEDGAIVYANKAARDLFEITMGEPVIIGADPDGSGRAADTDLFDILKRGPFVRELTVTMSNGAQRTILCSANRLFDEGCDESLYHASFRDITVRKQAEDALREGEARFRTLFERSNDAILLLDPTTHAVIDTNPQATRLLGVDRGVLLGTTTPRGMLFNDSQLSRFVDQVIAERNGRTDALTCRARDAEIPVELSASAIEIDGRPVVLIHMTDLTERKRIESTLERAKAEAEQASRAKTEFLASMSHELRTPLNAILGFSEILFQQAFGPLGSEQYLQYAKDIHDSGGHLLRIVNDILDLSKVEAGRFELTEGDVDVEGLFAASRRMVQEQADRAEVALEHVVTPPLRAVHADERVVMQILLNLLANALKFTPAGGRIALNASVEPNGEACIEVADTGCGIPADQLSDVLEPFTQVDGSLSRRHEGTGLGLALVRSFTRLHGGEVSVASTLGQGTTVTVYLPARRVLVFPEAAE